MFGMFQNLQDEMMRSFGFQDPFMPPRSSSLQPFNHNRQAMNPFSIFSQMDPISHFNNNINSMMSNMNNNGGPNCFQSSSVYSFSSDGVNQPNVYQETQSVRIGPDGRKEIKKKVRDSRYGKEKILHEKHLGERSHVYEKEKNLRTGDEEETTQYINMDEDEYEDFNNKWGNTPIEHASGSKRPSSKRNKRVAICDRPARFMSSLMKKKSNN